MVTFSVVIPHYNSFPLLRRCLNSIPKDESIQVVVVDDFSPDRESLELVRNDYQWVTFIALDKNVGAGKARNVGLEEVKGKWLLFADADDYFTSGAFDIFNDYINVSADIIHFKADSLDYKTGKATNRNARINTFVDNYSPEDDNSIGLLRYRSHYPVCKMIRFELIQKNNIRFEEIRYGNDTMFATILGAKARQIVVDKRVVYCITSMEGSLTRIFTKTSVKCRFELMVRVNHYLKEIGAGKFQCSVMMYLRQAASLNIFFACQLLFWGITHNANLFAGWRGWFRKK